MIESISEGMLTADAGGAHPVGQPAAEAMLGYAAASSAGSQPDRLIADSASSPAARAWSAASGGSRGPPQGPGRGVWRNSPCRAWRCPTTSTTC